MDHLQPSVNATGFPVLFGCPVCGRTMTIRLDTTKTTLECLFCDLLLEIEYDKFDSPEAMAEHLRTASWTVVVDS